MAESSVLLEGLRRFVGTPPSRYDFPTGGKNPIPLESETEFAGAIQAAMPIRNDDLEACRKELDDWTGHDVMIFAVRTAILAVRRNSSALFEVAMHAFVIDNGAVDSRSTQVALFILDDCAKRIGINLQTTFERLRHLIGKDLKRTIDEGYFARPADERTLSTMGVILKGSGEELTYEKKPWA